MITYTDPTAGDDTAAIQDVAGNDDATFTTGMNSVPAVTNNSDQTNNAPTGAPTITGTAQVGQTLTAVTTAIMDANGLNNVSYTYQWIRHDTGTGVDTIIAGATASTYTLVAADEGKTIKVKVSFTDDASNSETLTSVATAVVSAAATTVPGAPTSLTATASGTTTIDLSWTAPASTGGSAITGYKIEVSPDGSANWTDLVANTNSATTTYAHTGLAAGTTRHYRVSAINTTGTGLPSNVDNATTTAADTTPPTLTSATVLANGQIIELQLSENMKRSNLPPASAFTATAGGSAVTLSLVFTSTADTYWISVPSLTVIRQGQVVVVTYTDPSTGDDVNAIQDVAGNDDATFTTGMNGVPAVTNNSTVNTPATGAPTIAGTPQVGETLTAVTTAIMDANGLNNVSYTYQWIRVDGSDSNIAGATASTYTLVAADEGKTIKVKVSLTDDASNPETLTSVATAVVSAAAATVPGAPTGLTATASGNTQINLSWTAPASTGGSAITGYKIEVSSDGGSSWTDLVANTNSATTTSAQHTGLAAGTTRHYRVSAINTTGTGLPSNVDNATTNSPTNAVPTFTEGTTATRSVAENTAAGQNVGTAVGATDTDSGDTLEYSLHGTDAGSFSIVSTSGQIQTSAVLNHEAKASYSLTVRVSDGTATADIALTVNVTDVDEKPDQPAAPTVSGSTASVDVSWTAPGLNGGPAITRYDLRYRKGTTGSFTDGPQDVTGTSSAISGLDAGSLYQVQVRAENGETPSDWSPSGSGTTNSPAPGAPTIPTVWSGTLTVRNLSGVLGCSNGVSNGFCSVHLSDDAFTYDSTDYAIRTIFLRELSRRLELELAPALTTATQALTLTVDGTAFLFEDADVKGVSTRYWNNTGLSWTVGDTVSLTLTEPNLLLNFGTASDSSPVKVSERGTLHRFVLSLRTRPNAAPNGYPQQPVTIPLLVTHVGGATTADYEGLPASVTFGVGESEADFDLRAIPDQMIETGEGLRIDFGALPPGIVKGAWGPYETVEFVDGPVPSLGSTDPPGDGGGGGTDPPDDGTDPPGDGAGGGTDPPGGGGGGGGGGSGPLQTVPGAPINLVAVATDGAVTLTWDAPEDDGGSAITDYEYQINGRGSWTSIGSTLTTYTVTSLVNGTEYTFQVRAVNRIGRSQPSSDPSEATPRAAVALDFAHFANGDGTTSDLVFVNVASQPVRPALYFYDTEGALVSAESVVDVTGDLEIAEDGGLTVLTEMEPLGELTISTHGQGDLVSGSVRVVSEGPIGGMLRFEHPALGVAGVGAGPPVSDALFPVRRQEGGITTGVALHNLESSPALVRCDLMREGVLLDAASIPLEANGQTSWLLDQAFPAADTSDFAGAVRCDAVGEDLFTAVALEMDPATRTFITLPVFPVPEMQ